MILPDVGELIVGSYLRMRRNCEFVTYNLRMKEGQSEIDVAGLDIDEKRLYLCEVTTHLQGMLYTRKPRRQTYSEYRSYAGTLETIEDKLKTCYAYGEEITQRLDGVSFQVMLWSPKVPKGMLTEGLHHLKERLSKQYGSKAELVINEVYSASVDELRQLAQEKVKDYGDFFFRTLQILEHMK